MLQKVNLLSVLLSDEIFFTAWSCKLFHENSNEEKLLQSGGNE